MTTAGLARRRWRTRLASVEAAAIAGIICAVGWSVGLHGLLATPAIDASDAEIARYYRDTDGVRAVVLLQVIVVATIAFIWFVGVVRSRLGEQRAGHPERVGPG